MTATRDDGAPAIRTRGLRKVFSVPRREGGAVAALRSLFRREYDEVVALAGLDLEVAAGERIGFLGPNGAGKTTALKMLAGLLHPSAGELSVLGFEPRRRTHAFLRSIALVMGQKRQLSWDLPALDTFELNRVVFGVEAGDYRRRLDRMVEMLAIGDQIRRPVRQLSLGERMKCELVAALLHGPRLLFLDEPTLGMDVSMQHVIRNFVREYNEREGATVVLTSHDMDDVAALCPRVVIVDEGHKRFDGTIESLIASVRPHRCVRVVVDTHDAGASVHDLGRVFAGEGELTLEVAADRVEEAVGRLLALPGARELSVESPPLVEVMREIFEARENARNSVAGREGQGG